LSEPRAPAAPQASWSPNPLLAGRSSQTPHFLRTQWDEATARHFGPWRVSEPVDPVHSQTATALLGAREETDTAPDGQVHEPAAGADTLPPADEPIHSWSDAAIAALREQAYEEGVQEGLRQAREAWEVEKHKDKEVLRHLGIELRSLQQDPQRFFEPLKRLSLHIAEQWVRGELQVSGQVIDQLVRQCLAQLEPAGQTVHVELHPDDLQRLKALGEEATADFELQADAQLKPGSVRVRVNETVVQDLIEHRLEAMARKLLKSPQAWLEQSALLHPDKVSAVEEQDGMRQWARRSMEVEDLPARPMSPEAEPPTAQEP